MACGDLPPIPDIEIPEVPSIGVPEVPVFFNPPPSFGLPSLLVNFHPNLFDILILLWLIWQGLPFGTNPTPSQKNDALKDLFDWTQANETNSSPIDGYVVDAPSNFEVYSLVPFVKAIDLDATFNMIRRRYDNPNDSVFELIFGYVNDDLRNQYKNYKFDNRTMTRV